MVLWDVLRSQNNRDHFMIFHSLSAASKNGLLYFSSIPVLKACQQGQHHGGLHAGALRRMSSTKREICMGQVAGLEIDGGA